MRTLLILWSLAIEYTDTAKIITSDIKNCMNPLWEPLEIPSGHSVTDTIRTIRFHLEKIKKYANLIKAYRRREEEYKTNVWDTEEKRLKYVDGQAENLEIPFFLSTSPGFLAFLVCSHPIDFFVRRRFLLPFLVPPMTIEEEEDQDSEDNNADGGDEVGPSTAANKGCIISLF